MATLPTLSFGAYTNVSNTANVGASPLEEIASASTATYAYDETNSTHTGDAWFALGESLPADFGVMESSTSLSCRVQYAWSTTGLNLWNNIFARIYKSDGTTPLTNQSTLASSITTTTPANSSVVAFSGVDTTATKAEWEAAQIHLYWDISKNMGGDSGRQARIYAAELTGTYTVTLGPITPTPANAEADAVAPTVTLSNISLTPAAANAEADAVAPTVSVIDSPPAQLAPYVNSFEYWLNGSVAPFLIGIGTNEIDLPASDPLLWWMADSLLLDINDMDFHGGSMPLAIVQSVETFGLEYWDPTAPVPWLFEAQIGSYTPGAASLNYYCQII